MFLLPRNDNPAKPRDAPMAETIKLWTIQPWTVWEQVRAQGKVFVDSRYTANLHDCYEWLLEQLPKHISGYGNHYPWWAYCVRPDLRAQRHYHTLGERFVLMELELPKDRVLTFPFWAWDLIFRGQYLSVDRQESEDWENRLRVAVPDEDVYPYPEPWRSELVASWRRLFEPNLPDWAWSWLDEPPPSKREAVFEVLDRQYVRRVTSFIGTRANAPPRRFSVMEDPS